MNYSKHAIKGETMKEMQSDEIAKYGKDTNIISIRLTDSLPKTVQGTVFGEVVF